jgi:hypothetical protein
MSGGRPSARPGPITPARVLCGAESAATQARGAGVPAEVREQGRWQNRSKTGAPFRCASSPRGAATHLPRPRSQIPPRCAAPTRRTAIVRGSARHFGSRHLAFLPLHYIEGKSQRFVERGIRHCFSLGVELSALCPPSFRCLSWHVFPQYLTALHRLHELSLTRPLSPEMPQLAQASRAAAGECFCGAGVRRPSMCQHLARETATIALS